MYVTSLLGVFPLGPRLSALRTLMITVPFSAVSPVIGVGGLYGMGVEGPCCPPHLLSY